MSIDRRYDAFLSDLVTLFQELTVSYINQKAVDIDKFKHYFNFFYDRMQKLQDLFHQSKLKITQLLGRLKQICTSDSPANVRKQLKNNFYTNKQTTSHLEKSFNRSISSKKQTEISRELGKILEEVEYSKEVASKRSQTATGYRTLSYKDQKVSIRPKTGQKSTKKYNFNKQKMSQTITRKKDSLQKNQLKQVIYQQAHTLDSQEVVNKRKAFYQQLQKQKKGSSPSLPLGNQQMFWLLQRKKSHNGRVKRINRLF